MQVVEIAQLSRSIKKLTTAFEVLGGQAFPATKVAAGKASAYIEQTWVGYASGMPIPGVSKTVNNKRYRNAITRDRLSDFNWAVFVADEEVGDIVEEGTPQVDLKEHLPFPKSRRAKDGEPYSHIPFRHAQAGVARATPPAVRKQILKMEKSYVIGSQTDASGIKRFTYQWAQRDKQLDAQLKGTRLAGVVRFETSTGKSTSSAYMTFRTISTKSPPDSWIIKAKEGVALSQIVAKQTLPAVTKIIQQGVETDLNIL